MVYQEVIQERLAEVSLLLAQNREQQVGRALGTPVARRPGTSASGYVRSLAAPVAFSTRASLPPGPRWAPCVCHRRRSCVTWQGPKAPR